MNVLTKTAISTRTKVVIGVAVALGAAALAAGTLPLMRPTPIEVSNPYKEQLITEVLSDAISPEVVLGKFDMMLSADYPVIYSVIIKEAGESHNYSAFDSQFGLRVIDKNGIKISEDYQGERVGSLIYFNPNSYFKLPTQKPLTVYILARVNSLAQLPASGQFRLSFIQASSNEPNERQDPRSLVSPINLQNYLVRLKQSQSTGAQDGVANNEENEIEGQIKTNSTKYGTGIKTDIFQDELLPERVIGIVGVTLPKGVDEIETIGFIASNTDDISQAFGKLGLRVTDSNGEILRDDKWIDYAPNPSNVFYFGGNGEYLLKGKLLPIGKELIFKVVAKIIDTKKLPAKGQINLAIIHARNSNTGVYVTFDIGRLELQKYEININNLCGGEGQKACVRQGSHPGITFTGTGCKEQLAPTREGICVACGLENKKICPPKTNGTFFGCFPPFAGHNETCISCAPGQIYDGAGRCVVCGSHNAKACPSPTYGGNKGCAEGFILNENGECAPLLTQSSCGREGQKICQQKTEGTFFGCFPPFAGHNETCISCAPGQIYDGAGRCVVCGSHNAKACPSPTYGGNKGCAKGFILNENGECAPLAPSVSISANPRTVTSGEPFKLEWSAVNVSRCNVFRSDNPNVSGLFVPAKAGSSGSLQMTPVLISGNRAEVNYQFVCLDNSRKRIESNVIVTIAFAFPKAKPSIESFTMTGEPMLQVGEQTTIYWSSKYAVSCTASGSWSGEKQASGWENITPKKPGYETYGLQCFNLNGDASTPLAATPFVAASKYIQKTGTLDILSTTVTSNAPDSSSFDIVFNKAPGGPLGMILFEKPGNTRSISQFIPSIAALKTTVSFDSQTPLKPNTTYRYVITIQSGNTTDVATYTGTMTTSLTSNSACGGKEQKPCSKGTAGTAPDGCQPPYLASSQGGSFVYETIPKGNNILGRKPNFAKCAKDIDPEKWDVVPWLGYVVHSTDATAKDPDKCYDEYRVGKSKNINYAVYTKVKKSGIGAVCR